MMFRITLLSLMAIVLMVANADAQITSNPVVTTFRPYPGISVQPAPVISYYPAAPVVSYRAAFYYSRPLRGLPVVRSPLPVGNTVYSPVTVYAWPTTVAPQPVTTVPPNVTYFATPPQTVVSPPVTMGAGATPPARSGCGCSGN